MACNVPEYLILRRFLRMNCINVEKKESVMEYADIVDVLKVVPKNNSREWYMQEKEVFREIHITLTDLYFSVGNKIRKKVAIDIAPRKSISRPYNDQRFGCKPYLRERLWVTFQSNEMPAPAFFIEFSSHGVRIGMGYYSATPAQMRNLRAKIDDNPQNFSDKLEEILKDKDIQIVGESYKKEFHTNYQGWVKEIYNYRSVYFQKNIPSENFKKIEQIAVDTFLKLSTLYNLFTS